MTEPETVAVPVAPLQRALDRVSDIAVGVASLALLGLVVVQGWQVFTRYVLNDSPSWTEPVTLLLLSTALSLGAAAGVHTNRHFGFYLLGDHVPPLVRKMFEVIRPLMILSIGAVLAWWSAALLIDGLDIKMAGAQMPQSINYLPLSIGGALMVLFAVFKLWRVLRPVHVGGVR
ncbi:TRAP transporter small permease [Xanthomonas citri pv. mangiferaeindicae]|uniref:TRAP transporter small permease protein n=1 Tax=Xanthomonas axonopodis pv. melhusii TaxID=487834 RepID=A0A1T1NTJ1_9XANT|nr:MULTISPECIES: TRAP transporter small permease [Xanthomonas]OOW52217.1 C4-dicarboxylate ABC transporter [Xanthomonas campestris pv. centellae]OOW81712.1 C4-dicarboxylate ABC transporter [Xanthomonas campestris pv. vitiswoodrowii]WVK03932.1 TRAP transporter small permease [Xanthomonas campestris pv. olitorii]ASN03276.1 C4-dicarboxylate ABC transporter [Xanthomonas citri pv. malvacearum]ASN11502.1 C4-dicarboxylate ABC transporter [Xanthomonas citri pv. malvacearum]